MKKTRYALALGVLLIGAVSLTACTKESTPKKPAWNAPDGALVSVKTDTSPTLDGASDDAAWKDAPETAIKVTGGANKSATDVKIKSVYTADTVSFLAMWQDPTQSFIRAPWEKQKDGTWMQLKDPADKGGDNNLWYEDKMSMIWNIDNSIPDFDTQGCSVTCHAGDNPDIKPFGNKYTSAEGQLGDIWHWKSVRNVQQVDDQYLDSVILDPADLEKTKDAGRHSDPNDGGGYVDNKTEDGKLPAFMLPADGPKDGAPGFILDSEKLPFDDSKFVAGDRIPAIVTAPTTGDRADISAGWKWADGAWTLEFARKLTTGSEFDVQFTDLKPTYFFGTAIFDNAQVRHATARAVTPFVFKP